MANHYTLASFRVPCNNKEFAALAARIRETNAEEAENLGITNTDGEDASIERFTGVYEVVNGFLYVYHDETIDLEQAVFAMEQLLDLFPEKREISFTYAHTCSKPRTDEFGGGYVLIVAGKDGARPRTGWMDTGRSSLRDEAFALLVDDEDVAEDETSELRSALLFVQQALAADRDDEPIIHPEYGELKLEEVKYCVVDPALGNDEEPA